MFNYDNCVSLPLALIDNRLRCWCRFHIGSTSSEWNRCFLDTVAKKTVIPEKFWHPYSKKIGSIDRNKLIQAAIGGSVIPTLPMKLFLEVAGTEDSSPLGTNSIDLLDRGIISLGERDVLLAHDRTFPGVMKSSKQSDKPASVSMEFILLSLDALVSGGVCVNCSDNDAHLIFVKP